MARCDPADIATISASFVRVFFVIRKGERLCFLWSIFTFIFIDHMGQRANKRGKNGKGFACIGRFILRFIEMCTV